MRIILQRLYSKYDPKKVKASRKDQKAILSAHSAREKAINQETLENMQYLVENGPKKTGNGMINKTPEEVLGKAASKHKANNELKNLQLREAADRNRERIEAQINSREAQEKRAVRKQKRLAAAKQKSTVTPNPSTTGKAGFLRRNKKVLTGVAIGTAGVGLGLGAKAAYDKYQEKKKAEEARGRFA